MRFGNISNNMDFLFEIQFFIQFYHNVVQIVIYVHTKLVELMLEVE